MHKQLAVAVSQTDRNLSGSFVVMLTQIIADGIQRLGTDTKVLFKGGKLPVYDHKTSLPYWDNR